MNGPSSLEAEGEEEETVKLPRSLVNGDRNKVGSGPNVVLVITSQEYVCVRHIDSSRYIS